MINTAQRIVNGQLVYAAGDPNTSIWFLLSLFRKGAEINAQNEEGDTALHRSLTLKHSELAEFLISKEPDFALQNNKNQTALDIAKIHHHDHLIYNMTIATKAAQFTYKDLKLMMGVKYNFLAKVIEAVEEGADINMCDPNGTNSLHIASYNGQLDILQYLLSLKDKINLNLLDLHRASPIHYCLMQETKEVFDEVSYLLISSGSNIRINADDDIPALYKLSMRGYTKALSAVTNISEINHKIAAVNNNTMLHGAILGEKLSSVILLVMRSADPNIRNSDGHSSIDIAQGKSMDIHYFLTSYMTKFIGSIIKGDKKSIEKYIAKDFDPNVIFFHNQTPLNIAVENNQLEIAEIFLKHNASFVTNDFGQHPFKLSSERQNCAMTKLLLEHSLHQNEEYFYERSISEHFEACGLNKLSGSILLEKSYMEYFSDIEQPILDRL